MASGKNKSPSIGLRILWIPGRKKQPKGTYNPTNKGFRPPNKQDKKQEVWSLGGSKGQKELLKSDMPGNEVASTSTGVVTCLPPTIGINAAANGGTCAATNESPGKEDSKANGEAGTQAAAANSSPNDDIHSGKLINTDDGGSEPGMNGGPMRHRNGGLMNIEEEDERQDDLLDDDDYTPVDDISNTETLMLKNRKLSKKNDPNAGIDGKLLSANGKDDVADGILRSNSLNRKKYREKKYRESEKEKTGLNERAVDCLYYSLMCCQCSIQ